MDYIIKNNQGVIIIKKIIILIIISLVILSNFTLMFSYKLHLNDLLLMRTLVNLERAELQREEDMKELSIEEKNSLSGTSMSIIDQNGVVLDEIFIDNRAFYSLISNNIFLILLVVIIIKNNSAS